MEAELKGCVVHAEGQGLYRSSSVPRGGSLADVQRAWLRPWGVSFASFQARRTYRAGGHSGDPRGHWQIGGIA